MKRLNEKDIKAISSKPNYGVVGGIKSAFKREAILHKDRGERSVPELESGDRPKSVPPKELTTPDSRRCDVIIKVFRRRLTDTGNDCWKYHLDACRYLGWLADDDDATISLKEEPHVKVESDAEERVELTLTFHGFDQDDLIEYYKDGPKNQHHA